MGPEATGSTATLTAKLRNRRRAIIMVSSSGPYFHTIARQTPFKPLLKPNSGSPNTRIMLFSDHLIRQLYRVGHVAERPYRTTYEAAGPSCPDGGCTSRQYAEGGRIAQYDPTLRFTINRGAGSCRRRAPARSQPGGRWVDRIRPRPARRRYGDVRRPAPSGEEDRVSC